MHKRYGVPFMAALIIGVATYAVSAAAHYEPENWDHSDWFTVVVDANGTATGDCSGYQSQWFYYPESGWWNQWFFDGKYDPDRFKVVHVEFTLHGLIPDGGVNTQPDFGWAEIVFNWTTPAWDLLGMERPPLPQDFINPAGGTIPEDLYIGRSALLDVAGPGYYEFDYTIPWYNPAWVSLDVRGVDFAIGSVPGWIYHSCIVPEPGTLSLLGIGVAGLVARRIRKRS